MPSCAFAETWIHRAESVEVACWQRHAVPFQVLSRLSVAERARKGLQVRRVCHPVDCSCSPMTSLHIRGLIVLSSDVGPQCYYPFLEWIHLWRQKRLLGASQIRPRVKRYLSVAERLWFDVACGQACWQSSSAGHSQWTGTVLRHDRQCHCWNLFV